jgi:hypothetical protein
MFMRRRPLMRAAAIGGGAYVAGRHVARQSMARDEFTTAKARLLSS